MEVCKDLGDRRLFHCSECGYHIDDIYDGNTNTDNIKYSDDLVELRKQLDLENESTEIYYCPHCGRKIIYADDTV